MFNFYFFIFTACLTEKNFNLALLREELSSFRLFLQFLSSVQT